ncbi:MAG TPA: hypothetical protein ENO11_06480, partial [Desulfobacteraceae bacterium]|nr:hypothetical protein [Desulfobacteraceae bacterium]
MNKSRAIFILVVLVVVSGIWGSLADRKRIVLEKKLKETVEQMQKLTEQNTRQREQVLGKTAGLQETLAEKEEQLGKARKELVSLRKEIKVLESQISACNATIQKLNEDMAARAAGKTEPDKGAGPTPAENISGTVKGEQAAAAEKISENDLQSLLEQQQTAE